MSIFLAILVYALWASIFPLAKLTLEHSPPLFLVGARMLIGGTLILLYILCTNRSLFKISFKHLLSLLLLALISVYTANVLESWGLQYLTAAKACFIYSLSPFFSALFSYIHFNEKMNLRKFIGMLIGIVGVLPVLHTQKGTDELLTLIPSLSWAELSLMGAAISSVYGWVLLRKIIKDIPLSIANGSTMVFGGLFALIHSFFVENWNPIPVDRTEWASFGQLLIIMIVISNLICYNIQGMLFKRFTVTLLAFIGLFSPVFASLSGWLILGESLSIEIFLSTGILLFGLWIVYSAELRQGYLLKAPISRETFTA